MPEPVQPKTMDQVAEEIGGFLAAEEEPQKEEPQAEARPNNPPQRRKTMPCNKGYGKKYKSKKPVRKRSR